MNAYGHRRFWLGNLAVVERDEPGAAVHRVDDSCGNAAIVLLVGRQITPCGQRGD
jgi:hypothetical protein